MAWTAPKTWSVGETLTAANFNTHIRDNELAGYNHLIARKTSDQNSTSLTHADVTSLAVPLLANEVWQFEFMIMYSAPTAGDMAIRFTFPAAGRIDSSIAFWDDVGTMNVSRWSGTTSPTTTVNFSGRTTERDILTIPGIFANAGTGGNLQLQFAQVAVSGTTTIYTNSTVWAVKLA